MGQAAVEWAAAYSESLRERRVTRPTTAEAVRGLLDRRLPREGCGFGELMQVVDGVVAEFSRHNAHPRFFGYVASPGVAVAAAASLIQAVLNINVTGWRSGPVATEMERLTVEWLAGTDRDAGGGDGAAGERRVDGEPRGVGGGAGDEGERRGVRHRGDALLGEEGGAAAGDGSGAAGSAGRGAADGRGGAGADGAGGSGGGIGAGGGGGERGHGGHGGGGPDRGDRGRGAERGIVAARGRGVRRAGGDGSLGAGAVRRDRGGGLGVARSAQMAVPAGGDGVRAVPGRGSGAGGVRGDGGVHTGGGAGERRGVRVLGLRSGTLAAVPRAAVMDADPERGRGGAGGGDRGEPGVRAVLRGTGAGLRGAGDAGAGGTVGVLFPVPAAGLRGGPGRVERAGDVAAAAGREQLCIEHEGAGGVRAARAAC